MESVAVEFNPFMNPTLNDPDVALSRARAEEPVFYSPLLQAWVVTRYEDIDEVVRNTELYSSEPMEANQMWGPLAPEVIELWGDEVEQAFALGGMDPPHHTRLRRMVGAAFTNTRVAKMEKDVRTIATRLVDGFVDEGSVNLLTEFAYPLPLTTIFRLIGIPEEDDDKVRAMCFDIAELPMASYVSGVEEQLRMGQSVLEYHRYLRGLIQAREAESRDDLISELIAARDQDVDTMSEEEFISIMFGLTFGGYETTANTIALAMWYLLSDRTRWERLVGDRSLIEGAIEETLRFDAPATAIFRKTTAEAEISGVSIPADARLFLMVWSGNRDESVFKDAGEFQLDRPRDAAHLAFGRGIHFCAGAGLARIEGRVALEVLAERLPDLHLTEKEIDFEPRFLLRRLQRVPVAWTAPARSG